MASVWHTERVLMTVFLVLVLFTGSGNSVLQKLYPVANMETCIKAVASANVSISNGGDAEGGAVLFCVNGRGIDDD